MLNKRWKVFLLNSLKATIKKYLKNENSSNSPLSVFTDNKILIAFFKPLYCINWYVFMGDELTSPENTISYITRYTKRPPISEARIINYDGSNVTITYKERENSSPVFWTMPVFKFIKLLIQHILPKNFRVVRSYGILANKIKAKLLEIMHKLKGVIKQTISNLSYRQRQIDYTNNDPLLCPICKKEMELIEITFFSKKLNGLSVFYC